MKKIFSDRLNLVEGFIILFPLLSYYFISIQNSNLNPEFIINIIFITLFITMFIFHNASRRHMYFGFIFLFLTAIGSMGSFDNFTFITGSLALSLLILGVINMLIFNPKD